MRQCNVNKANSLQGWDSFVANIPEDLSGDTFLHIVRSLPGGSATHRVWQDFLLVKKTEMAALRKALKIEQKFPEKKKFSYCAADRFKAYKLRVSIEKRFCDGRCFLS